MLRQLNPVDAPLTHGSIPKEIGFIRDKYALTLREVLSELIKAFQYMLVRAICVPHTSPIGP